jgi:hypothetical protein
MVERLALVCPGSAQKAAGAALAAAVLIVSFGSFFLKPAAAVDKAVAAARSAPGHPYKSAMDALRQYRVEARSGDLASSLAALRYAADAGQLLAQWKLGAMYRSGEGVPQDDAQAYRYFSRIVDNYDEDEADWRESSIVSSAFVAVGAYCLQGIAGGVLAPDPSRALQLFHYAATTFGDPVAQYDLARMYLDGVGVTRDPEQAARWLNLAADKGDKDAEALLGNLLFKGDGPVQPQRALGLMYLTLAREAATGGAHDAWIVDLHESALGSATDAEKGTARKLLENFVSRSVGGVTAQR